METASVSIFRVPTAPGVRVTPNPTLDLAPIGSSRYGVGNAPAPKRFVGGIQMPQPQGGPQAIGRASPQFIDQSDARVVGGLIGAGVLAATGIGCIASAKSFKTTRAGIGLGLIVAGALVFVAVARQ